MKPCFCGFLTLVAFVLIVGPAFSQDATAPADKWAAFCAKNNLNAGGYQASKALPEALFPIGIWFDGRVEGINCPAGSVNVPAGEPAAREYYAKNFKDIKQHNVDIVVIPNTPPAYRPWLLDEADKAGVKVVLEIVEFVEAIHKSSFAEEDWDKILPVVQAVHNQVGKYNSLLFYQLVDEPPTTMLPTLKGFTKVLGAVDPKRAAFSCLCGINDKEELIKQWDPAMLVFDCYPLGQASAPGAFGGFCPSVDMAYKYAAGRPFWMVVQTFGSPANCRVPSCEEIRAMSYLSLLHGAKGLFFFLHNSNTQTEKLIGLDQLPAQWTEVSQIAQKVNQLSSALINLKIVGPIPGLPPTVEGQTFRDRDGGYVMFVVNKDVAQPYDGALNLRVPSGKKLTDVLSSEVLEAEGAGVRLKLLPGEGRIFKMK